MTTFPESGQPRMKHAKHAAPEQIDLLESDSDFPEETTEIKKAAFSHAAKPEPELEQPAENIVEIAEDTVSKPGKKKTLMVVLITLVSLVLVLGLIGAAALFFLEKSLSIDNSEENNRLRETLVTQENKEQPFYVLLLGLDLEQNGIARSDAMILARVDVNTSKITLVSIPRDTMVDIPGYGRSKINAAYAYGGAAGAVEAVNRFAGISINHYIEIDFEGLVELVDAVGGIWVDVPVANDQTGANNVNIIINEGYQWMDGETALSFARSRYGYYEGDFQRANNQKIVVEALIQQMLTMSPTELPGVISSLINCVKTDMSLTDILHYAQLFQASESETTIYLATVPSSPMYLDQVSYVITDHAAWSAMMARVDAGVDPNATTITQDASGEPTEGEASSEEGNTNSN